MSYDRLLAAETDEGVVLYCYRQANLGFFQGNTFSSMEGNLTYRKKGETVTVMAAPCHFLFSDKSEHIEFPVILFDACPKAARAELDLYLEYGDDGYSYQLEARREQGGFFTFWLVGDNGGRELGMEVFALNELCRLYTDGFGYGSGYPAAVRLYDTKDELIYEEELTLRSIAAQAHARREMEIS